jgi:hypothetical protein
VVETATAKIGIIVWVVLQFLPADEF